MHPTEGPFGGTNATRSLQSYICLLLFLVDGKKNIVCSDFEKQALMWNLLNTKYKYQYLGLEKGICGIAR